MGISNEGEEVNGLKERSGGADYSDTGMAVLLNYVESQVLCRMRLCRGLPSGCVVQALGLLQKGAGDPGPPQRQESINGFLKV